MQKIDAQQVAVSGFIQNRDGHILFVKRANDDTFLPGYWELPGGKVELGESLHGSLIREIKEECGLNIIASYPLVIGNYVYKRKRTGEVIQFFEVFTKCILINPQQPVILSHEHSDYKWLTPNEAKEIEITDYIQDMLSQILSHPLIQ